MEATRGVKSSEVGHSRTEGRTVSCACSTGVVIAQDLPRTFPSNAWVASAEGQSALRNILLAFSVHKPDVGYCQSMNFVAAMLLLCLDLSEERAFWVMVALIDDNGQWLAPHPPLHLIMSSMLLLCQ